MSEFRTSAASRRARWFYVLCILFSISGIILLAGRVDPKMVGETMKSVDLGYFALSTLIAIGIQVLLAMRWRVLLGYRLPLRHSITASFVGLSVNAITPLRLGEIVRASLIRRSAQIPMSESIPSIVLGQLLDLLTLVVLGIIVLMTAPLPHQLAGTIMTVGIGGVLSLMILYVITHTSSTQRQQVKSILTHYFGDQVMRFMQRIESRIRVGLSALNNRSQFLHAMLLSLVFWLILAQANWLLLPTLVEAPSIWMGITLSFASGLGRVAPALPGDIGTLDLAVTLSLVALGISEEIAITVALLIRIRYIIMIVVIGLIGIGGEGIGLARIYQLAHEGQSKNEVANS